VIRHPSTPMFRRFESPFKRSFATATRIVLVLAACLALFAALVLATDAAHIEAPSIYFIAIALTAASVTVITTRSQTRKPARTTVIIAGSGPLSAILSASLQHSTIAGRILGVRLDRNATEFVRVLTFSEAISHGRVDPGRTIIVVEDPTSSEWRPFENESDRVQFVPATDVLERLTERLSLDLPAGEEFGRGFAHSHEWPLRFRIIKRSIDIAAAIGLGIFVLPILGLVELRYRSIAQVSALEGETCAGRGGSSFKFWRICNPIDASGGAKESKLFRRLERLHLDLSPAVLNLLKGEISLVGPQPELMAESQSRLSEFPSYKVRLSVSPGLTGWAQLKLGGADRHPPRSLEYDLYYIKHASLALDLRILAATLVELTLRIGRRSPLEVHMNVAGAAAPPVADVCHQPAHPVVISFPDPRLADDLEPTLIVGAGDGGVLLLNEMRRNRNWSFRPVAFADDDPLKLGSTVQSIPVVGKIAEISEIVDRWNIKVVVIAIPSASEAALNRIADIARQSHARVLTMPNIGALLRGDETVRSLRDATIDDVLGRSQVSPDLSRCRRFISGRRVLITGAAGSIGSEVARQVANLDPELILAVDVNESGMFDLCQELGLSMPQVKVEPIPASVTNRVRLSQTFERFRPEIVFHAAAYKHVPMMEEWPEEAVMVNAVGSARVARVAASFGVERLVLVSTDKAVRPTSVMGATKRLAELSVRAVGKETGLSTCCVRFGNVLGSRGSVIPIFERQINAGGPVTVTDPGMMRFFMTIPEAASLITEAGAMGHADAIYMLEMGDEVSILDLAERMIRLSGREVGRDIDIVFTGLRPGEKLREELSGATEFSLATDHRKIRLLRDHAAGRPSVDLLHDLDRIEHIACEGDHRRLRSLLFTMIDEKQPRGRDTNKLNGHRSGGHEQEREMQPAC
jgi:FlaA1/EpsC-like NDP-sugar epimerase/lipopolysaccharide/colanic/teichoic acid biosynthesis glycosyltransferase